MERLTEWIPGEHKAIPRIDLRSNGYENVLLDLQNTKIPD